MIHHAKFNWIAPVLSALVVLSTSFASADFKPKLFAFQNGCRFENLQQEVETLKKLGYVGVGSAKLGGLKDRISAYQRAGMQVASIYVGAHLNANGGHYDEGIPAAIDLLKGTDAIVELTVQGKAENAEEQAVKVIREVADLAAKANLRVALYPHDSFYVERIPEALQLIKKVDRQNVGLTFNLCHYLKNESNAELEQTIARAAPFLFQVTICGADNDGKNWGQLIQTLDKGTFDQRRLLNAMHAAKFQGMVGLQCYNIKGDSGELLSNSMSAWKALQAQDLE